ncbi:hypothetical protein BH18ACI4_BH18ACI4_17420 [soil metagenome]
MTSFFDYFQIASVVIFLLILVGNAFYLRFTRNINPIAIGGGKRGLVLAVEVFDLSGLAAWMVEILLYAVHSSFHIFPSSWNVQLVDSLWARVIGVLMVTLGLIIFILAYVSFGDSWRVDFDVKTPGALVTTGIFAMSRNPIYLFLDLWSFGIFLINGTPMFLIFAALTAAVVHWQILQEEKFLFHLYSQSYQDYRVRTGRYVSWPGR